MHEFRITLIDGVMHYLKGTSAKSLRKYFERNYPSLPNIKSIKRLRVA